MSGIPLLITHKILKKISKKILKKLFANINNIYYICFMTRKFKKFIGHFLGVADLTGCKEFTLWSDEEAYRASYLIILDELKKSDTDKINIEIMESNITIKYKRIILNIVKD